jgi:hypothetical protein
MSEAYNSGYSHGVGVATLYLRGRQADRDEAMRQMAHGAKKQEARRAHGFMVGVSDKIEQETGRVPAEVQRVMGFWSS